MPKRSGYTQGTPSWVDIQTTDQAAAKAFYGGLFGWEYDDQEIPGGAIYSMALKNDAPVAGIAPLPEQLASRGVPSMWNTYIAVDDVDAATERATEANGQVAMPPFDVMAAGRMAYVIDPSGATLGLWQAKDHIGAGLVNEDGTLIWNELNTDNEAAVLPFYEKVFGLCAQTIDMGGASYTLLEVGPAQVAGITSAQPGVPNHWGVYFAVDDAEASAKKISSLGGTVLVSPFDMPVGKMTVARDPQGANFMTLQPAGEAS